MTIGSSKARRRIRQRKRHIRLVIFAGIAISVLALAGYLLKEAFFRPPPPPMAGNVIDIAADMGGFSTQEVRVRAGEEVTIRLESLDNRFHTDGGGQHQWAVDELGVDIIAQPLSTSYATFTPDTPGTYTFYCDICCGGRANPSMQGTLIVEA
jgi:cytochrome c oxidase subunit II